MTSDERMTASPSGERAGGVEGEYFAFLSRRDWRIQRCDGCGRHVFYPRQICPHCGSAALAWVRPGGTGRIYSLTTVPPARAGEPPRHIALVDLDEGVRLMSCVDPCPADGLRIGDRVMARIDALPQDGQALAVVFSKVQANDGPE